MRLSKRDKVVLALLAIGLVLIAVGMALLDRGHVFITTGLLSWVIAYWAVLFDNFQSKRPVQTRGGVVKISDGRFRYALPYVPLVLFGMGLAVVVFFL